MNQLTPEQLDMIKRLQPLFKEKMGEWQVGDIIVYGNFTAVIVQIKKEDGVIYARFEDSQEFLAVDRITFADKNWLRIPKPIDWQNPERGCWGMVDKNRWTIISHNSNDWIIQDNSNKRTKLCDSIIADPVTALLMALCEQEGV